MRHLLCLLPPLLMLGCASAAPSSALQERRAAYGALEDAGTLDFLLGDFQGLSRGSLETFAVPWKVTSTALLLAHNPPGAPFDEAAAGRLMQRYGFFRPARLANWTEATPAPVLQRPLGVVTGMLAVAPGLEVQVANQGCATCHVARGYDAQGRPTDEAWLGLASSSINYEAYARDVFRALAQVVARDDAEGFVREVRRAFPDTSEAEVRALRRVVLPALRERMAERARSGSFLDFTGGAPGLTNGVATLQLMLGVPESHGEDAALVSVPSLYGRSLRTSLLWDGVYAPPGRTRFAPMTPADVSPAHLDAVGAIPAVFTTGTLGIAPRVGAGNVPRVRAVFRAVGRAEAPPFPGALDETLVAAGEARFVERCGGCHGTYDRSTRPARLLRYPNRLTPQAAMGTDPLRWRRASGQVLQAFARSEFGRFVEAKETGGYVAPILTAVWATAPYLHNGSVPTLWHLLHPQARPPRFLHGGHRLDFARVGIALDAQDPTHYPAGEVPWSEPALYDTALPGQSNAGHERSFSDLDESDLRALLEYLKVL